MGDGRNVPPLRKEGKAQHVEKQGVTKKRIYGANPWVFMQRQVAKPTRYRYFCARKLGACRGRAIIHLLVGCCVLRSLPIARLRDCQTDTRNRTA